MKEMFEKASSPCQHFLGSFYYFFISYFFWILKIEKVLKVVKRIV